MQRAQIDSEFQVAPEEVSSKDAAASSLFSSDVHGCDVSQDENPMQSNEQLPQQFTNRLSFTLCERSSCSTASTFNSKINDTAPRFETDFVVSAICSLVMQQKASFRN